MFMYIASIKKKLRALNEHNILDDTRHKCHAMISTLTSLNTSLKICIKHNQDGQNKIKVDFVQ